MEILESGLFWKKPDGTMERVNLMSKQDVDDMVNEYIDMEKARVKHIMKKLRRYAKRSKQYDKP